jgi:hypothetical protein
VRTALVSAAVWLGACHVLLPLDQAVSTDRGPTGDQAARDSLDHDHPGDGDSSGLPDDRLLDVRPVDLPDLASDMPIGDLPNSQLDASPVDQAPSSCLQKVGWTCSAATTTETCFLTCDQWTLSCWWEKNTKTSSCSCRVGTSIPTNCAALLPRSPLSCDACIAALPQCCF